MADKVRFNDMKDFLTRNNVQLPLSVRMYGRVRYSHIRTKVDGAELQASIEREKKLGLKPEMNPHYLITIDSNIQIQPEANVPDIVVQYLAGKISDKGIYSIKSKSPFPPVFSMGQGLEPLMGTNENGEPAQVTNTGMLPAELGKGLLVCLGISIYGSPNGMGVGLDYVVALENAKFIQTNPGANRMAETLSKIGIVDPNMFPQQADEPAGTPDTVPQAANPMANAQNVQAGAQAPTPMQAAAAYGQQPAAQQAVPQAGGYYAQPGGVNPGFMQPPAGDPVYGTPAAQGAAATPQAPTPGIMYQRS